VFIKFLEKSRPSKKLLNKQMATSALWNTEPQRPEAAKNKVDS